MATLNLYVTDDLKGQMTEHELNWSRIASDAITTAINLERTKQVNVEQASIERLRASKQKVMVQREAEGVTLGKQWALEVADYEQLERVAKLAEEALEDDDQSANAARALAAAILGEHANWSEVVEELEPIFGEGHLPRDAEVNGFVAGAAEIFATV